MIVFLARHGESVLNVEGRVNGDPDVPAPLSERGRDEARLLGAEIANVEIDLCIHSSFERARETARIALDGREVPFAVEPLLDDIKIGELEGQSLADYRVVKRQIGRKQPFPGGESLDDAAERYAVAFERLTGAGAERVLVVCHEIPVRYALNSAAGADALDGPPFHDIRNAVPYLFDGATLGRAAARIRELAQ
ncbi:MAG TPA: histidine phosphatase family protein [Gaiellaceae bacterium]|nr:histidine phosphatase family protein [Gaiellaceae bacterium]